MINIKKIIKIFAVLLLAVLIVGCNNKPKKEIIISYSAVFENGDNKVRTFQYKDKVYYRIDSKGTFQEGSAVLKDNKIDIKVDDGNATLEFINKAVNISGKSEKIEFGEYKKIKDYTEDEFYKDYIGEKEFANSEINGIYIKDNISIYVYQQDKDLIKIYIDSDNFKSIYQLAFRKGKYFMFNYHERIDLTTAKDEINLEVTVNNDLSYLNGKYTKKSNLDIDDILDKFK